MMIRKNTPSTNQSSDSIIPKQCHQRRETRPFAHIRSDIYPSVIYHWECTSYEPEREKNTYCQYAPLWNYNREWSSAYLPHSGYLQRRSIATHSNQLKSWNMSVDFWFHTGIHCFINAGLCVLMNHGGSCERSVIAYGTKRRRSYEWDCVCVSGSFSTSWDWTVRFCAAMKSPFESVIPFHDSSQAWQYNN